MQVKCLLIVPNPESALNEEAGRLLLEDYAAFASRARMQTSVHAEKREQKEGEVAGDASSGNVPAGALKKRKAAVAQKKRKALRRL